VQAERRLERSRNVTSAAVPLTEANATAFCFPSATSAREAAAERALVGTDTIGLNAIEPPDEKSFLEVRLTILKNTLTIR
jgi:hypothetical protein